MKSHILQWENKFFRHETIHKERKMKVCKYKLKAGLLWLLCGLLWLVPAALAQDGEPVLTINFSVDFGLPESYDEYDEANGVYSLKFQQGLAEDRELPKVCLNGAGDNYYTPKFFKWTKDAKIADGEAITKIAAGTTGVINLFANYKER